MGKKGVDYSFRFSLIFLLSALHLHLFCITNLLRETEDINSSIWRVKCLNREKGREKMKRGRYTQQRKTNFVYCLVLNFTDCRLALFSLKLSNWRPTSHNVSNTYIKTHHQSNLAFKQYELKYNFLIWSKVWYIFIN